METTEEGAWQLMVFDAFCGEAYPLSRHADEAECRKAARAYLRRTMSLFNQGWFWYRAIPGMHEDRLQMLMQAFGRIVSQHAVTREIFGVI